MELLVSIKSNYGRELIYPECKRSRVFCEIAGTSTLTRATLESIKTLGYTIAVRAQVL